MFKRKGGGVPVDLVFWGIPNSDNIKMIVSSGQNPIRDKASKYSSLQ